jgi:hypothetical protein
LVCLPEGSSGEEAARSVGISADLSEAQRDKRGSLVHTVRSEYQRGQTKIRVLLPDRLDRSVRYRVLYVLPVEAGDGHRWGDGLEEVRAQELHTKHRLICVLPTFSHLPSCTDHPTDPQIRQESYLLKLAAPTRQPYRQTGGAGKRNCLVWANGWSNGQRRVILREDPRPTAAGAALR